MTDTRTRKKITALVPCYNEEASIGDVIKGFPVEKLYVHGYDLEIVVIDNASTDKTAAIARGLGVTVIHEARKGKGNAMRRGFDYVGDDTDYVVMLDGDNTYRPREIARMIEPLDSGFCDVVIGSRLGGRIVDGSMTFTNRAGNWIFSHLVRYFYRVNVTDVLSGYFAWKRETLVQVRPHLTSLGFAIEMEMITKMAQLGAQMYCVPISYEHRSGHSNLRPFYDGVRILAMFARNLFWHAKSPATARVLPQGENKKKHIVIVASYYPPHLGGLEIVAQNQAELLASHGYDVTVITSSVAPEEIDFTRGPLKVLRVRAWNIFERWGAPFPLFSPRLLWVLGKEVWKADVVHIHDAFYMSSWCAAIFAWIYRKPIVLTQHVEMINHPRAVVMAAQRLVYATTGRLIFRISHRIITLNDRVEQFLIDRGIEREKLVSLANGVDLDLFHPVSRETKQALRQKFNLSLEKRLVLFVGRFVPKKGFDILLAAQSEGYQIVFVGGEAPQENNVNAVFLGKLPQASVAELYQAADLLVLPSTGEGFPLSIQEAMASGLPIVTTHDDGYRRYNLDTNLISFIRQPTPLSLREAITTIIDDIPRLEAMATYSRSYAENHFAWGTLVPKLVDIYDTLPV